jgi:c-di-GMP-binding flagellar brake protein YcgR
MQTALENHPATSRRSSMSSGTASREERPGSQDRSNCRYSVTADVTYQLTGYDKTITAGSGRSVDISSGGVLLETEDILPVGVDIALQIAWPAKLDQQVRLALHVRGRTVRSDGNHTAVVITGKEFHTRRQAMTNEKAAADLL